MNGNIKLKFKSSMEADKKITTSGGTIHLDNPTDESLCSLVTEPKAELVRRKHANKILYQAKNCKRAKILSYKAKKS